MKEIIQNLFTLFNLSKNFKISLKDTITKTK